jgi:methylase of polypeptide subunit release factors
MHHLVAALWWALLLAASTVTSYTILGGIDEKKDEANEENENNNFVKQTLRHLQQKEVELRIQSHEPSGRVSMAGTLWEASPLLADYITNPACPIEAFQRMKIHDEDENARLQPQPSTVVELGSGVGLASLAAAFLGCRVFATDGAPSSIRLMKENFEKQTASTTSRLGRY